MHFQVLRAFCLNLVNSFECIEQAAVSESLRERERERGSASGRSGDSARVGTHRDAAYWALLRCCCRLYTNRKFVAALCACCVCTRDAANHLGHLHALSLALCLALSLSTVLSQHSLRLRLVRVTLLAALFACSPKMRVPVIMCALALASCVCRERVCLCESVCVRASCD